MAMGTDTIDTETSADVFERARFWAAHDIDSSSSAELLALVEKGEADAVADRMAGPLQFGTAGLRGIIGAGPNRMNKAVVARATYGLAMHLLNSFPDARSRGVVIGYDARRMSQAFAEQAAVVLAGLGFIVHIFADLATTPQTAFGTLQLGAVAGIMITASHNPPGYNGFKVYWSNGAQIIPPHDEIIAAAIDASPHADCIQTPLLSSAVSDGLIRYIDSSLNEKYLSEIGKLSLHGEGREGMCIVYTPMHGVGMQSALEALRRAGFDNVVPVKKQSAPDGDFPTVRFPNPEEPGALDLAISTAREVKADLILANDPDADRLAVAVPARDADGFVQLTGNQVGVLIANYFMNYDPNPPDDRLFVTTIVSSPMLAAMARVEGARFEETLTGFKWIANCAMALEAKTGTTFVAGYEEALGYTVGTIVRDKDGVSAAVVFAEMAAFLRSQGKTVLSELDCMYRKYGLFVSRQVSRWHRGSDGSARIRSLMSGLRNAPPASVAGLEVVGMRDFELGLRTNRDGTVSPLSVSRGDGVSRLPSSDVLAFDLAGGSRIVARPSGTEPKIKFYFDHCETVSDSESMVDSEIRANRRIDSLVEAFLAIMDSRFPITGHRDAPVSQSVE